jgi:hypothetical protein
MKVAKRFFFRKHFLPVALADGFANPHVQFHSIAEVFSWIREAKLQYIGSWPPIELSQYPRLLMQKSITKSSTIWYRKFFFFLVEFLWALRMKSVMINITVQKL